MQHIDSEGPRVSVVSRRAVTDPLHAPMADLRDSVTQADAGPAAALLDKLLTSDITRERLIALLRTEQAEVSRLTLEAANLESALTKAHICIETAIEEGRPPNRPL